MKQAKYLLVIPVVVIFIASIMAIGQSVPQLINFQGRLTNPSGQPLDGVSVDLTFKFYGVETGNTPTYLSVLQEDVVVTKGIYNTMIGSGTITPGTESTLADVFQNHEEVWVGVKVDSDSEMTPRQRIGSVPFALAAKAPEGPESCACECDDIDGDGHYKPRSSCTPNDDCNDLDASAYPGAPEICDKKDNDCDGMIDEDCSMALIPSGCFDMGDAFSEGWGDELPVHNVCITSSFYMDVHEVTNAEYAACVSGGGCTAPSDSSSDTRGSYYGNPTYDNFPVIYVNWNQATAYCSWAGKRLPTEAEWEYAARGGLSGKRYPWGDSTSGTDANYLNSGDPWDNDTSPVENYAANGYGLYDMSGNLWEWVNDRYSSTYYQYCVDNTIVNDPPGPASGTDRVLRGGGWDNNTYYLRAASRFYFTPTNQNYYIGFRCARD